MAKQFDERVLPIEALLRRIEGLGDLTQFNSEYLHALETKLVEARDECDAILNRHRQDEPSPGWLALSIGSTIGSVLLTSLVPVAILVTIGGTLATVKAVYDSKDYAALEDYYRTLGYRVFSRLIEIEGIRNKASEGY